MRTFNYSLIKDQKWDSELLGYIAAIYREAGKQERLPIRDISSSAKGMMKTMSMKNPPTMLT